MKPRVQAPPSARHTVCIDLDATIIPWGQLHRVIDPYPGAADAIRKMKARGFRIIILTSRLSPTWWLAEAHTRNVDYFKFGEEQRVLVKAILDAADIPYDLITSEKLPALAYFDDKAVRVSEAYPLDKAIEDFLNGAVA